MHEERRQYTRKKLNKPVTVLDLNGDAALGTLVDISVGGLMVLGYGEVAVSGIFQLSLQLPDEFDCGSTITCGAESLWQEASNETGKFWIGFQIIDIAPEEISKVERLISVL